MTSRASRAGCNGSIGRVDLQHVCSTVHRTNKARTTTQPSRACSSAPRCGPVKCITVSAVALRIDSLAMSPQAAITVEVRGQGQLCTIFTNQNQALSDASTNQSSPVKARRLAPLPDSEWMGRRSRYGCKPHNVCKPHLADPKMQQSKVRLALFCFGLSVQS
jgi:hypothetical protein